MPVFPLRPLRRFMHSNIFMPATTSNLLLSNRCSSISSSFFSLFPPHRFFQVHTYLHVLRTPLPYSSRAAPCGSLRSSGFSPIAHVTTSGEVDLVQSDDEVVESRLAQMKAKLQAEGIYIGICKPGQHSNLICPKCEGGQSQERSFSLLIGNDGEYAMWTCFRSKCGWQGRIQASGKGRGNQSLQPAGQGTKETVKNKQPRVITEEELNLEPLCDQIIMYFSERGISVETLRRNAVMQRQVYDRIVIAFTYRRNGMLVGCKYRDIQKMFWQEANTEKILYGLDDIKQASEIIIVEGEIDKLSMEEAGYSNCVSVPDGAPAKVSEKNVPDEEQDTKYSYLWNCKEYLKKASRIIIATDSDQPGQALAEELARRIGKERCWRVKWPERRSQICKDANEVLVYLGVDALRQAVDAAEFYPVRGLFMFRDYFHEIDSYYNLGCGYEVGISTGWKTVDEYYKVVPGELTVVTGVPNSGKSEWIDALLCNINHATGWRFALCSMENKVREHARKLLEKHCQKPFFNASYGDSVDRMTVEEFEEGKKWLNDAFFLIRSEDHCFPSVDWVLQLAKIAVLRHGIRGLVIDPYNELDHQRTKHLTETEYVSQILGKIRRFAQHHGCHVWFVAHPRQLQNWNGTPPSMYDISGSAHFVNKCDNGIVIHRNRDAERGPIDCVQVCVRKVRNKVIGKLGDAFLSYNRATGEYCDFIEHKDYRN